MSSENNYDTFLKDKRIFPSESLCLLFDVMKLQYMVKNSNANIAKTKTLTNYSKYNKHDFKIIQVS